MTPRRRRWKTRSFSRNGNVLRTTPGSRTSASRIWRALWICLRVRPTSAADGNSLCALCTVNLRAPPFALTSPLACAPSYSSAHDSGSRIDSPMNVNLFSLEKRRFLRYKLKIEFRSTVSTKPLFGCKTRPFSVITRDATYFA